MRNWGQRFGLRRKENVNADLSRQQRETWIEIGLNDSDRIDRMYVHFGGRIDGVDLTHGL